MAKVYFDEGSINLTKKRQRKADSTRKSETKAESKRPTTAQAKKKQQSWGAQLKPLFDAMTFINKYRLYRPYRYIPYSTVYGWGHLVGKMGLYSSGGVRYKIRQSMRAFFPNAPKPLIEKLVLASCKFYGGMLLDFMFNLPLTTEPNIPYDHFFAWKNPEVLDRLLEGGKGVIVPVTHIGSFLATMPAFSLAPYDWQIASVANLENSSFYQYLINKPHFNRLWVYPSISFKKIGHHLEQHLKDNFVLVMFCDYSTPRHLRVPFIEGEYPYLIHSVQSVIRLHQKTGAPILPCISHPNGSIGRLRLEFLENSRIMDASRTYWDAPSKEFHGRVSMEINRAIYPYIRSYAHVWEEIMNFATLRLADKLVIEKGTTLQAFVQQVFEKLGQIIEMSWEPGRPDDQLVAEFKRQQSDVEGALENPEQIITMKEWKIDLSMMNGKSEILLLCDEGIKLAEKYNEFNLVASLKEFRFGIANIFAQSSY